MKTRGLLPLVAGLGSAAVTVLYVVIMANQDSLVRETVRVVVITLTFASSAGTLLVAAMLPSSPRRIILLTWGSTVALFWTVLLNTLTPLWLPVAVLSWIATVGETRSFGREDGGGSAWPLVGGTWAICVAVLGITFFASVAADRSPLSGTGEGIAMPR